MQVSVRRSGLTLADGSNLWDLSYAEREWLESFADTAASEEAFQLLMCERKKELLWKKQEESNARAAMQKAKRQAKRAGVTYWQGLIDGVLSVQELARLEGLCKLHGLTIIVKFWNSLGEESTWEFSKESKGLQIELQSDSVKTVLKQATDENFGLLMELADYSMEAVTQEYRFRSTTHIKRCVAGYAWLHQQCTAGRL